MTAYDRAEWRATHSNGKISRDELAEIAGDLDKDLDGPPIMHPEAAWNYQRMRDAAKDAGVRLAISYSYRNYETQEHKYDLYKNHGGNLAAKPGTSNHGWGLALDLKIDESSDPAFVWLKGNAREFGFFNDDAPSEPWHWDYEGGHPIEEDQMTPEELAEFKALKKIVADHEELITALREGLNSPEDPADFMWAGKRVATSVRKSETGRKDGSDGDDAPTKPEGVKKPKAAKAPG